MRAIKRFFHNVWRFRRELADFRDFDRHYNYDLFMRSLELTRDHLISHHFYVGHEKDAAKIDEAIAAWKVVDGYPDWETENAAWAGLHRILVDHGMEWWC